MSDFTAPATGTSTTTTTPRDAPGTRRPARTPRRPAGPVWPGRARRRRARTPANPSQAIHAGHEAPAPARAATRRRVTGGGRGAAAAGRGPQRPASTGTTASEIPGSTARPRRPRAARARSHRRAAVARLDLDRRQSRDGHRIFGEVGQRRPDEEGADVGEQQQARQHEERDDQDHRHDADEHVGDDQLAAHAPEELRAAGRREPDQRGCRRRRQRDAAQRAEALDARAPPRPAAPSPR